MKADLLRVPDCMLERFLVIYHIVIHCYDDRAWIGFNPQCWHQLCERSVIFIGTHNLDIRPSREPFRNNVLFI